MSPKYARYDSINKPKISVKKSSTDAGTRRQDVPYCVEVHEPITVAMDEVFASTKRKKMSSMMSPTYSI